MLHGAGMSTALERTEREYAGREEMPLGGYAAIMGAFVALFGPMLFVASRRGALPRSWRLRDIVLIGIASHKFSRILTRDTVTAPLRAPFTRFEKKIGAGEVEEKPRGRGLQRALGSLASCQYCSSVWTAASLTALHLARPRMARTVAAVLTMVTVSDWMHRAYAKLQP